MENTPQLQRKSSLSLNSRLKKRHSGSPQSLVKSSTANNVLNGDFNANSEVPRSPSMHSVCSDGGIECTPPHKKRTVRVCDIGDGDYSPKMFNNSFSPSCFLSQTMAIDSPEVGWKWTRHTSSMGIGEMASTRTPDSAYAADSSFTSAGSSSTEMTNARARSDNYNKRMANDARKEQELRRFEKTRADEKLKQRCAKFQEQLKSAGAQRFFTSQCNGSDKSVTTNSTASTTSMDIAMISQTTTSTLKLESPLRMNEKVVAAVPSEDTLNDFFNDSASDYFLLAATQEIESKIDAKQQVTTRTSPTITTIPVDAQKCKSMNSNYNSNSTTISTCSSSATSETCTPHTKEKRSSFYMKFLEDDCTDDWFISLDEVILQATQSKKPRTSLHRYKSMPTNSNDGKAVADNAVTKSDPMVNGSTVSFVESASPSSATRSKIKRHSSSHTLSPANSNYRHRLNHLKK